MARIVKKVLKNQKCQEANGARHVVPTTGLYVCMLVFTMEVERGGEVLSSSEEAQMSGENMLIDEECMVPHYTEGRWT